MADIRVKHSHLPLPPRPPTKQLPDIYFVKYILILINTSPRGNSIIDLNIETQFLMKDFGYATIIKYLNHTSLFSSLTLSVEIFFYMDTQNYKPVYDSMYGANLNGTILLLYNKNISLCFDICFIMWTTNVSTHIYFFVMQTNKMSWEIGNKHK